jgi:hypothetical protein
MKIYGLIKEYLIVLKYDHKVKIEREKIIQKLIELVYQNKLFPPSHFK